MKKCIKLFALLLFFSATPAFASKTQKNQIEVENGYGYGSIGVGPLPIPAPNFGLGYRHQFHHYGYDLSLQLCSLVVITEVKANMLYHYYFKPNLNSQFYCGGGIGIGGVFNHERKRDNFATFSPEFVFGKEYRNESQDRRFIQVQVSWPTVVLKDFPNHYTGMPLVTFSYGIGF